MMAFAPQRILERVQSLLPARLRWLVASDKGRYLVAGAWNTLVGLALFAGLYTLAERQAPAFAASFAGTCAVLALSHTLSVANSYFVQRAFVFLMATPPGWREYLRFNLSYAGNLAVGFVLMKVFADHMGVDPRLVQLASVAIGAVVGYLAHSKFSFKRAQ